MAEAIVHPVPSETTIIEDTRDLASTMKRFYYNNREVVLITTVIGVALLINRRMLRKELKRLNFEVEVFGDFDHSDVDLFNMNTER